MKCKFYAQKGNEQKERDTCDRFNLTGLDSYLLEFTTRNLRGFVLKILKIMLFSKQNLLLNNTLGHKTLRVTNVAKPQLKSENPVLFSAIIRIVFENEVSSTPKLQSFETSRLNSTGNFS